MSKISRNLFLLAVAAPLAWVTTHCSQNTDTYANKFSNKRLSNVRVAKELNLFQRIISRHCDCDSFLIRYSPYRNLMGILLVDYENNGYKIEVFDIYAQKKIFDFEPFTMPIDDFRLNEDTVIVNFADMYGTQIAYDVFTTEVVWSTH